MTHAQLQQEQEESKLEFRRFRERMSLGTPTAHKDISIILPSRGGQVLCRRIL